MADYKQNLNEKPLKRQYIEAELDSLLEDILKESGSENMSQSEKEFLDIIDILERRYKGTEKMVRYFKERYNEIKAKKSNAKQILKT